MTSFGDRLLGTLLSGVARLSPKWTPPSIPPSGPSTSTSNTPAFVAQAGPGDTITVATSAAMDTTEDTTCAIAADRPDRSARPAAGASKKSKLVRSNSTLSSIHT